MKLRWCCLLVSVLVWAQPPAKQKITRAAGVPQFQYAISGKVEDVLRSDEAFRPLALQIRKNIEAVLRDYEIDDIATRTRLLDTLAALDVLENRDSDARKIIEEVRLFQEKPAARMLGGSGGSLWMRAILDARRQTSGRTADEYSGAVYRAVKGVLDGMPYDIVQNDVQQLKSNLEASSEALMIGRVRSTFEPVITKTGGLSSTLAHGLPAIRLMLVEVLPLKTTLVEAVGSYLTAHGKEKQDIWAARSMDLPAGRDYTPVNVGVWDEGVDIAIFKEQVVKESSGQPAVIAYDRELRKSTGAPPPLTPEQSRRYAEVMKHLQGMSDSEANLDTPDAADFRKVITGLKPDQAPIFQSELSLFSRYTHGTHVSGILLAGNPYARLVIGGKTFDDNPIKACPSDERIERMARVHYDYVDFFKAHGVRIVNMSWGGSVKSMEDALEQCGIGRPGDERRQLARRWFDIWKKSLDEALRSAPEILFIAASGNSNSDASFDEGVPASLRMPNLLTVGAVDGGGDETKFTSYGSTVAVHANGYQVESYIPGGRRLRLSGTSMAAPNVANLAAKILAVKPNFKPPEVIALIRQTADKTDDGRRNLIHPRKAVAAAAK